MRVAPLLLVIALTTGCANSAVAVSAGSASAATAPGTASASGGGPLLAFLLMLGFIDYVTNPQPFPSPSSLMAPTPPAPDMASGRRISEQDCSKPVDISLGNLRCK